jgi:hypothetical protein
MQSICTRHESHCDVKHWHALRVTVQRPVMSENIYRWVCGLCVCSSTQFAIYGSWRTRVARWFFETWHDDVSLDPGVWWSFGLDRRACAFGVRMVACRLDVDPFYGVSFQDACQWRDVSIYIFEVLSWLLYSDEWLCTCLSKPILWESARPPAVSIAFELSRNNFDWNFGNTLACKLKAHYSKLKIGS